MNFERLYKDELSICLNNSDTVNLYTSTRRRQAINDAVNEFVSLTECCIRDGFITCSCNTVAYNVLDGSTMTVSGGASSNFMRLSKEGVEFFRTDSNDVLRVASGSDFPQRTVDWMNKYEPGWRESTAPVDFPSGYFLRHEGGNLYIRLTQPPDVGSSDSVQLAVHYVARPAPMTSTDSEPFTFNSSVRTDLREYHFAFPRYAAYKLLNLIGDKQDAKENLQLFLGYVTRYLQEQRPKGGTHVTPARSYFRESRRLGSRSDLASADPRFGVRS